MRPPTPQIEVLRKTGALAGRETGVARSVDGADLRRAELIVNADGWGLDRGTTDRTLDCFLANAISSVSAMVLMADSKRAAEIARMHGIDAGLPMNFTAKYSAQGCSSSLLKHQQEIASALTAPRERNYLNQLYRRMLHRRLARQCRVASYFFDCIPRSRSIDCRASSILGRGSMSKLKHIRYAKRSTDS